MCLDMFLFLAGLSQVITLSQTFFFAKTLPNGHSVTSCHIQHEFFLAGVAPNNFFAEHTLSTFITYGQSSSTWLSQLFHFLAFLLEKVKKSKSNRTIS